MKPNSVLCICGDWSDKHRVCELDDCHESVHMDCTVPDCGCGWFVTDREAMRDMEVEAQEREREFRRERL